MHLLNRLACPTVLCLILASATVGAQPENGPQWLSNPFFAFDNGTGRGVVPPPQQASLLAELDYNGLGYTGTKGIPAMLEALDKHDLKMFSIYVASRVGKNGPSYDPGLPQAIQDLKGRDTFIWLTVQGQSDDDQQAVTVVRQVADLAQQAGMRVALYPHVGFYVASTDDALRIVEKADRKNLGVSFNLCHCLKLGNEPKIPSILKRALPHLFLVSINGADHEGNWDRLIQTLDRGQYDVFAFLTRLRQLGYEGPIGLQCYNIPGDIRTNLTRSIGAWKQFAARMEKE
jgi:sugar phosphate isomerase/epimerase